MVGMCVFLCAVNAVNGGVSWLRPGRAPEHVTVGSRLMSLALALLLRYKFRSNFFALQMHIALWSKILIRLESASCFLIILILDIA